MLGITMATMMGGSSEITFIANSFLAQTGTTLNWTPPTHESGDLLLAIIWGDQNALATWDGVNGYTPTSVNTYNLTTHSGRIYRMVGDGTTTTKLYTTVSTSLRQHIHWYVFRNGTGATASSATTVNSVAPNPPSHTTTSGYGKYYWIALAASTNTYTPAAAPSGYANLLGASATLVTSWTCWKTTTSNTEDPGAFTTSMALGAAVTVGVY